MSDTTSIDEAAPPQRGGNGSVVPFTAGPGTDFVAVAIGAGANLEALPAYFTDPLLATGNMPGIAISAFNNRALRQGTFVASSLCQWISDQTNLYVPDDGNQINWISEFQNALAAFVEALIPPGPNLGAYLPLAGGQMVGNITFQTGITTILANNTWYRALDTAGQARGLIIKDSANNVTVNDGSSPYVVIGGAPVANNNFAWSGKDSSGNIHPVIGLLSDNNIHIGSVATTDIYFDETTAVHHAGNFILNNNRYVMANDPGGTARQLLGLTTANALAIGQGVTGEIDIYGTPPSSGAPGIWLRSAVTATAVFQVNGYTYLNGGARSYIPGGNDPHQIYADHGYYARHHYIVGGTRDWSVGCISGGNFNISDESAAAVRWQIDTSGNITSYNSQTVNGNMTVGGNFQCNNSINASANLSCSNTLFVYNQAQVWNSVVVQSGALYVQNGGISAAGGITGNPVNSNGDCTIAGNFQCNNNVNCNTFSTNAIQDNGNCQINGSITVNGNSNFQTTYANRAIVMYSDALYAYNGVVLVPEPDGNGYVGLGSAGWLGMFAFGFYVRSDQRDKADIAPVPGGCLEAVRQIVPQTYRLADKLGGRGSAMPSAMAHEVEANAPPTDPNPDQVMVDRKAEMDKTRNRQYWGFVSQDVGRVMREAGLEFGGHSVCDDCDTESLGMMDMLAVLWAAVRELSDEVKQLKAA